MISIGLVLTALLWLPGPGTSLAADSQIMPLAAQSLLLDGQVIGDRIVVAGERGHILISEDQGASWQQQQVPTRTTLTSVFFIDQQHGWAAGHDSVILQTEDGGRHWQLLRNVPEDDRAILDLWFQDREHGFAVGAYGLFWTTRDGGASWQVLDFQPADLGGASDREGTRPVEENLAVDFHLNQITATADGHLFIAAEAGNLYRSADGGSTWVNLPSPYEGSFYGTLPLATGTILAFGLRGHLFASADAGDSWAEVETGTQATINDGILLADGRIALAGLAGTLLFSEDQGRSFQVQPLVDRAGISRVMQVDDGALLLVGEHGARRLPLPGKGKGASQ